MGRGKFNKVRRGGGHSFSRQIAEASGYINAINDRDERPKTTQKAESSSSSSSNESSSSSSDESEDYGIAANPNRSKVGTGKIADLTAMEKARSKDKYWKMHEQGKTDQARADLARLTLIRQQREETARQRLEEKKRSFAS